MNFYSPRRLGEALQFIHCHHPRQDTVVLAGGTDLMLKIKKGLCRPARMLNIRHIQELREIVFVGKHYEIGSAVTFTELVVHPGINEHFPALCEACLQVGSKQIRNMGTIGGNLCNASPAADAAIALIAYDADLVLASTAGSSRTVKCDRFFTGPGSTVLEPGEILTKILLPIPDQTVLSTFLKIRRTAVDIAIVGLSTTLRRDAAGRVAESTRIAMGAVAPRPLNAERAVDILIGHELTPDLIAKAAQAAVEQTSPITDHRASRDYRLQMVRVLVEEALLGFMRQDRRDLSTKGAN